MKTKPNQTAAFNAEHALKIGVKKALDLHAKLEVPAVIMKNGKIFYIMPDGTMKEKDTVSEKESCQE